MTNFELQASTKQGTVLVELAETHVADFSSRADEHDRDGTFPVENFDAMKRSRVLAAPIPEQFGGLGVDSLHDVMVAVSRLARACPSTAIAANMHIGFMWVMARWWRNAPPDDAALLEAMLPAFGASEAIVCGAGTEAGAPIWAPRTTATRTDGGFLLNGRKVFATNSEIAGAFGVMARITGEDGRDYSAGAFVPAGSPGLEVRRTWDALGMRASCSHEVVFENCFVPEQMLHAGAPLGTWDAAAIAALIAVNFPLIGAYVGIAESARDLALSATRTRCSEDRPAVQHLVAEIEIDLCAARAALSRTAVAIDEYVAAPDAALELDRMQALVADWQCAKMIVMRSAQHAVDTAMHVAGGASYMSAHTLSRLYRDVRAGWFHQPFSPVEAHEYVGRRALGLDPGPTLDTR